MDNLESGPQGEPQVVHVDQERDFAVTVLAANFAEFIRKLVPSEEFEE